MVEFYKGSGITLGTGVIFLIITVVLFMYFSTRITKCVIAPVGAQIPIGATEEVLYMLSCDYVKSFVGVLLAFFTVGLVLIFYGFIERAKEKKSDIKTIDSNIRIK